MRCYNLTTARQNLDRVTVLILDAQKLEQIPPEVWQMPKLETLDLRRNALKALPPNLATLSSLKTLLLGQNQLKTLPDQLPNLVQIDLSKNRFAHFPVVLNHLKELQSLNLSSNRLRHLPELNFPALKSLHLSTNKIEEGCFVAKGLPKLEKLDLAHNALQKIEFRGNFSTLQSLNLTNNKLQILPNNWELMPFLRQLDLSNNQLEHLPVSLGSCVWLKTLLLNKNKLVLKNRYFSTFQRLEELYVADNAFNQVPDLPATLRKIDLARNQVTHIPAVLFQIPNLRLLDLSYNPLSSLKGVEQAVQLSQLGLKGVSLNNLAQELLAVSGSIVLKTSSADTQWARFLNFLRACQRKTISLNARRSLWMAHEQQIAVKTLSLDQIMQGLNLGIPAFQERLRKHLLGEPSSPLTVIPEALALIGRSTQNKVSLQARLAEKGIQLQKPDQCKVWVLGKAPYPEKLPLIPNIQWLDERMLEQILERELPSFDPTEQQNLQQLLTQRDPQFVHLAVQLLSHHGVPVSLLPSLYLVWRWTADDKLRRELRALLERYWPSSKRALLRSREKISPDLSGEEVEIQLQKIARLLETD